MRDWKGVFVRKRPICQMALAFVVGLLIECDPIPKSQLTYRFPDISGEVWNWLFFGIGIFVLALMIYIGSKVKNLNGKASGKKSFWLSVRANRTLARKGVLLFGCLLMGQWIMQQASCPQLSDSQAEDSVITITGRIQTYEIKDQNIYYYVTTNSFYHGVLVIEKASSTTSGDLTPISIGTTITATGSLRRFTEPTNPGQFHQKRYYQTKNMEYSIRNASLRIVNEKKRFVRDWLKRAQMDMSRNMQKLAGEPYGGILAAMLFGEKETMDPVVQKQFQRNGIAHILAISGLHVSILGISICKLLERAKCPLVVSSLLGAGMVLVFGIFTGMSVSTMRAVVMYLLMMFSRIVGRTYDMPSALSLAALLVLLWHPYAIFWSSMQFSFGAILALIHMDWIQKSGIGKYLQKKTPAFLNGLAVSGHIQLVTLPVQLYHTFSFSVFSSLLNFFVIPSMSLILFFGMASAFILALFREYLTWLATALLWPCKMLLWLYQQSCLLAEKLPQGVQVLGRPFWWQMALYYLLLLLFSVGMVTGGVKDRQKRSKTICKRIISWGSLLLPIVMVWLLRPVKMAELEITMLDVGQGECICMELPDHRVILSDGGSLDIYQTGTYRIKPFLLAKGISKIDAVLVSHWDQDHISGVKELLKEFPKEIAMETLILPKEAEPMDALLKELVELAESAGVHVQYVEKGASATIGQVSFTCLWPKAGLAVTDANGYSAVYKIEYRGFQMLLTGDIPMEYEEQLWEENARILECDVLKVAHHGSKNSTSNEFLQKVQPRVALISCGADNSYGHPHKELLRRLDDVSCKTWTTKDCGAITLRIRKDQIQIFTFVKPGV